MKRAVFIKLYQYQKRVCYSPRFYPRPPKKLHRYICHICDIMQLCFVELGRRDSRFLTVISKILTIMFLFMTDIFMILKVVILE